MPAPSLSVDAYRALAGSTLGHSSWYRLDQARIQAFADTTEDWQAIHVDEASAAQGPFGATIAHGFLSLSMLSAMAAEVLPRIEGNTRSINYGFNSLRFISPVRSGRRVRALFELRAVEQRASGAIQSTLGVSVEIEGESKPALVAEWITLSQH
ncbi:MaoC family dehydratase [Hydrocarboniphaga effusa]|jgi:acyl dehydratase|uniref:MaoC family dehydratase n=1 Tax=Hydrocarboniphaga effusa TaxID=243629 RepID=UPI0031383919